VFPPVNRRALKRTPVVRVRGIGTPGDNGTKHGGSFTGGVEDHERRDTLGLIREVNLSYIMLAQRLLREDRLTGMFRLGLSAQSAELLATLTLAQVVKLAASDQLLCQSRLNNHTILSTLTQSGGHVDVTPAHTAILLASQKAEHFV
jgi:flagellar transcriptional activator FlhD